MTSVTRSREFFFVFLGMFWWFVSCVNEIDLMFMFCIFLGLNYKNVDDLGSNANNLNGNPRILLKHQ